MNKITIFLCYLIASNSVLGQSVFKWPEGKKMAISLTFDDARPSQVDTGYQFLNAYDAKATFYVLPGPVEHRLNEWKDLLNSGHEIGNHSIKHPCTGNFNWSRGKALESYSLRQMEEELKEANLKIHELLGVNAVSFAYPCGQSFVGRGKQTKSYIPLIAELFESGRGWMDEAPNAPDYCDFAQLTGVEMDGKSFQELLPVIEAARQQGAWLILAGHEIGTEGGQTTLFSMLEQLIPYAQDEENGIWLGTVQEINQFVKQSRE